MPKNAVINFRVEKKIKTDMERTCYGMGINMSTAFELFCRKVIEEKKIPFEIRGFNEKEVGAEDGKVCNRY